MTPGRRRASVAVVGIEGRVGRRRVVVVAWTLWGSVCALSLLLIVLTIAFHLVTRYDWYFGDSFHPWRTQTVGALGTLGAPILGALIVWRQPTNRYGWVWCLLGTGGPWRRLGLASLGLACGADDPAVRLPGGLARDCDGHPGFGAGPAGAAGVPRRAAPVAALATGGLGERGRLVAWLLSTAVAPAR